MRRRCLCLVVEHKGLCVRGISCRCVAIGKWHSRSSPRAHCLSICMILGMNSGYFCTCLASISSMYSEPPRGAPNIFMPFVLMRSCLMYVFSSVVSAVACDVLSLKAPRGQYAVVFSLFSFTQSSYLSARLHYRSPSLPFRGLLLCRYHLDRLLSSALPHHFLSVSIHVPFSWQLL